MNLSVRNVGLVLAALALVGIACSKSTPSGTSTPSAGASTGSTITIDGKSATNKGTQDLTGKSTFDLNLDNDGGQYYFEPTVLKGAPGEKVTLTLKNVGNIQHNFTIDAQNINTDVNAPGSSATVTVTFPQTGSVQFHCEYHQNLGMVGELSVS